jgi:hypothetical protein
MLPSSAIPSQAFRRVGVGIDTSRYGHYACFLGDPPMLSRAVSLVTLSGLMTPNSWTAGFA